MYHKIHDHIVLAAITPDALVIVHQAMAEHDKDNTLEENVSMSATVPGYAALTLKDC